MAFNSQNSKLIITLTVLLTFFAQGAIAKVATVSPIAHSIADELVKNTGIELTYLPPKRLPINRIPNWLNKQKTKQFAQFDVVISMASVRPKLDFFKTLRQSNIRLVEIDIAHALIPNGERVALDQNNEYFWLNSNNLLLMTSILKRDLVTMWPQHKKTIEKNFFALSAEIRLLNQTTDQALMEHDIAFLSAQNSNLKPYSESLICDFENKSQIESLGLNYLQLITKKSNASQNTWLIDDLSRFKTASLTSRLQNNLDSLLKSLPPLNNEVQL